MVNKLTSINLYKKTKKDPIDQFLSWALTYGRFVVILTQVIALSAFLMRFSLDRQLIDLHDKIKQKEAIVNLLKNNEKKFRELQSRIAVAATFSNNTTETMQLLSDIYAKSSNITINLLTVSEGSIELEGSVQSITSLRDFINNLKGDPRIKSVNINKIENKTSSAKININISAQLKQKTIGE